MKEKQLPIDKQSNKGNRKATQGTQKQQKQEVEPQPIKNINQIENVPKSLHNHVWQLPFHFRIDKNAGKHSKFKQIHLQPYAIIFEGRYKCRLSQINRGILR